MAAGIPIPGGDGLRPAGLLLRERNLQQWVFLSIETSSTANDRVGGRPLVERPSSHTTVRTVRYTAVQPHRCKILAPNSFFSLTAVGAPRFCVSFVFQLSFHRKPLFSRYSAFNTPTTFRSLLKILRLFDPSRIPPVLWSLLTSCSSLLLQHVYAVCKISPGKGINFPPT